MLVLFFLHQFCSKFIKLELCVACAWRCLVVLDTSVTPPPPPWWNPPRVIVFVSLCLEALTQSSHIKRSQRSRIWQLDIFLTLQPQPQPVEADFIKGIRSDLRASFTPYSLQRLTRMHAHTQKGSPMEPRPPPCVYELIRLLPTGWKWEHQQRVAARSHIGRLVYARADSRRVRLRVVLLLFFLVRMVRFGHRSPLTRHPRWQSGINNASAAGWATVSSIIRRLSSSVPFRQSSAGKTKVRKGGG